MFRFRRRIYRNVIYQFSINIKKRRKKLNWYIMQWRKKHI